MSLSQMIQTTNARSVAVISLAMFWLHCCHTAHIIAQEIRPLSKDRIRGSNPGEQVANSVDQTFCWCPAGSFQMGSPENEVGRSYDEVPVKVSITRGFWISKFEVTEAEYKEVTGRTARKPQGDRFPCVDMRSSDARRYVEKLTEREHKSGHLPLDWTYSLPTEAEWEYACRARTNTPYSFGQSISRLPDHGNFADRKLYELKPSDYRYADRNLDDGFALAAPVGSYRANSWGIHDMHGNVWEWCSDNYSQKLPGGADPLGAEKGDGRGRVIRGGSWLSIPSYCRSAMRNAQHDLNDAPYIGIRVVLRPKRIIEK